MLSVFRRLTSDGRWFSSDDSCNQKQRNLFIQFCPLQRVSSRQFRASKQIQFSEQLTRRHGAWCCKGGWPLPGLTAFTWISAAFTDNGQGSRDRGGGSLKDQGWGLRGESKQDEDRAEAGRGRESDPFISRPSARPSELLPAPAQPKQLSHEIIKTQLRCPLPTELRKFRWSLTLN